MNRIPERRKLFFSRCEENFYFWQFGRIILSFVHIGLIWESQTGILVSERSAKPVNCKFPLFWRKQKPNSKQKKTGIKNKMFFSKEKAKIFKMGPRTSSSPWRQSHTAWTHWPAFSRMLKYVSLSQKHNKLYPVKEGFFVDWIRFGSWHFFSVSQSISLSTFSHEIYQISN